MGPSEVLLHVSSKTAFIIAVSFSKKKVSIYLCEAVEVEIYAFDGKTCSNFVGLQTEKT